MLKPKGGIGLINQKSSQKEIEKGKEGFIR
jgi:hypothetical protein